MDRVTPTCNIHCLEQARSALNRPLRLHRPRIDLMGRSTRVNCIRRRCRSWDGSRASRFVSRSSTPGPTIRRSFQSVLGPTERHSDYSPAENQHIAPAENPVSVPDSEEVSRIRRAWRGFWSAVDWLMGAIALIFGLAIFAVIPVLNFLSLELWFFVRFFHGFPCLN